MGLSQTEHEFLSLCVTNSKLHVSLDKSKKKNNGESLSQKQAKNNYKIIEKIDGFNY